MKDASAELPFTAVLMLSGSDCRRFRKSFLPTDTQLLLHNKLRKIEIFWILLVCKSSPPIFANSTVSMVSQGIVKKYQDTPKHKVGRPKLSQAGCTCLQPSQDKEKGKDSAVVLQLAKTKMCSSQPANAGSDG